MSTNIKGSERSPAEFFAGFANWSDNWVNGMQDAEQRMRRLQHATDELNAAVYRTSIGQMEDMFSTFSRMSELLTQARQPGELISAQPDMLKCVMEAAQNSNRRLLALADDVRQCGMGMVGSEAQAAPAANGVAQQAAAPAAVPGVSTTQDADTAN